MAVSKAFTGETGAGRQRPALPDVHLLPTPQEALLVILKSLMPACLFNIIGFGSTFKTLFPASQTYCEVGDGGDTCPWCWEGAGAPADDSLLGRRAWPSPARASRISGLIWVAPTSYRL